MLSIEEMKKLLAESQQGVWIKTRPDDVYTKFRVYGKVVADLPVDLREDLCGWERMGIGYVPRFVTKQHQWDEWLQKFRAIKGNWCEKNTSE